jgi:hypothetical protein
MTTEVAKRISQAWLDQKNQLLAITRKELSNGSLNPSYVSLQSEIEQAEEDKNRWDAFESWVNQNFDARINRYPVKTAEGQVDACFYSKAKNQVLSFEFAWVKYQEAVAKEYTIEFNSSGEVCEGRFSHDTDAQAWVESVLEQRGYDAAELVSGDWDADRMLFWANVADADNDPGANAICKLCKLGYE